MTDTPEKGSLSKRYESTDPNEVITYYKIETRNEEGYFYEQRLICLVKSCQKAGKGRLHIQQPKKK